MNAWEGDRDRQSERQSPDWHKKEKCRSGDRRSEEKGRSGDRRSQGSQGSRGSRGWYSRGYLPHRDEEGLIQHVTVHLADSLPKSAIEEIERALEDWPEDERAVERRRRLHEWVDAGHGLCVLRHREVAEMVQGTLHHFDGVRYHLYAWVVMPNHVHVLFEPVNDWALNKIVASWKKFTGRRIREFLREGGIANLPIGTKSKTANREIGGPSKTANQEIGGSGGGACGIGSFGTGIFAMRRIISRHLNTFTTIRWRLVW